jgi:hypothetical protein
MAESATLPDEKLLAECDVQTFRASGPGGQKRNKTDSAVRIIHRPSGIVAIANESRSQHENRARALKRLRKTLTLRMRRSLEDGVVPEAIGAVIGRDGRLRVGLRDARFLPAAGAVLDVLQATEGSVSAAAQRIGLSTANLSSFITADEDVLVEANRLRAFFGLRPLVKN